MMSCDPCSYESLRMKLYQLQKEISQITGMVSVLSGGGGVRCQLSLML